MPISEFGSAAAREQSTARASSAAPSYRAVREFSQILCAPLVPEDYVIQTMPDVSPTKWHLAHTSWFFETFVLGRAIPDYRPFHPSYNYLFNSYYNAIGVRHCRPKRGQLARPTVAEVYRYRKYVDEHMLDLLEGKQRDHLTAAIASVVELGMHHEQQHQELIVTDLKHVFACNPLYPVYRHRKLLPSDTAAPLRWVAFPEGIYWIGHEGDAFAFDNESPRHRVFADAFCLASRPGHKRRVQSVHSGCDDSKNKHATKHFHSTGHPIVQSFEPGEDWLWCYGDQLSMEPPLNLKEVGR